jgi:hypothetical protein
MIATRPFENVAKLKYLYFGTAMTIYSLIHKEIKNKLNSVNAYYLPV